MASDPQRTCVGCGRTAAPDRLVRLVRRLDGGLEVSRHAPGRGAWLCAASSACVAQAVRRKAFARAFRDPVTPEAVEALRKEL